MTLQIKKNAKQYDVCIVGSGAGGGMAAYMLSKAGAKVLLLEAGRHYDSEKGTMFKFPYESPRRGASTDSRPFGEFDACWGGWDIDGEPYTTKDNTKFDWFRARMLGGRTNHWGRISLRFGPLDFKRRSRDGMGDDWPIGYEDVAPYYDKVDKLVGIFGTKEGIMNEPDGIFLPAPKPRLHELMVKKGADKLGIPMIPSRLSILTQALDHPDAAHRAPCHYCGACNRSCSTHSNFSSPSVLLTPALKTGNLEIITNAMVREVKTDASGKATGVSYINTEDLQEYEVSAKIVVLAASAAESARLLLNSKSPRFENGLGNSSGIVGKYIHDSTGSHRSAFVPSLMDRKIYNEDGTGGMHMYIPWWLNDKKLDFPRGYHIEVWGGMGMPSYGFGGGIEAMNGKYLNKPAGGYGKGLKEDYTRFYGANIGFGGRGESIAMESNYCEIDLEKVDKYGIPILRFHYKWSDYEIKQAKHMQDTFEEIIHSMGATALGDKATKENDYGLLAPGRIIHEVGTTRMGNDSKRSVVNKFNQAHDVKNLFVVDGGPFVSQADKNPTWTILALAMRASEYIMEQVKAKNL